MLHSRGNQSLGHGPVPVCALLRAGQEGSDDRSPDRTIIDLGYNSPPAVRLSLILCILIQVSHPTAKFILSAGQGDKLEISPEAWESFFYINKRLTGRTAQGSQTKKRHCDGAVRDKREEGNMTARGAVIARDADIKETAM